MLTQTPPTLTVGALAQIGSPGDLVDAQQMWRFILLVLFLMNAFRCHI